LKKFHCFHCRRFEKIFNTVQFTLDENREKERARLSSGESRTFFLTGILYCEECKRPLIGSSGHGRKNAYQYYTHRSIRGEPVTCELKTIRADKIERAVFQHLDHVIFREGYLEALENRLGLARKKLKSETKDTDSKLDASLMQLNREIRATIKLAASMPDEEGDQTLKDMLSDLRSQKIQVERQMTQIREDMIEEETESNNERMAATLTAALEFKKLKSKATPASRKRLLQRVISAISINGNSARIAYWGTQHSQNQNTSNTVAVVSDQKSGATGLLPIGSRKLSIIQILWDVPALPMLNSNGPVLSGFVIKNGAPARARTWDPRVRNTML
jgi:hypothetical protein